MSKIILLSIFVFSLCSPCFAEWPVKYTCNDENFVMVNSAYGIRTYLDGDFHDGIDLSMPSGTYASSVTDGMVIYSRVVSGYNHVVIVQDAWRGASLLLSY